MVTQKSPIHLFMPLFHWSVSKVVIFLRQREWQSILHSGRSGPTKFPICLTYYAPNIFWFGALVGIFLVIFQVWSKAMSKISSYPTSCAIHQPLFLRQLDGACSRLEGRKSSLEKCYFWTTMQSFRISFEWKNCNYFSFFKLLVIFSVCCNSPQGMGKWEINLLPFTPLCWLCLILDMSPVSLWVLTTSLLTALNISGMTAY